jgi:hypothetical protein
MDIIGGVASPHWWIGLGLQLISAAYWVSQMSTGGYVDSENSIHPRHPSSHWLGTRAAPFLDEKKLCATTARFFSANRAARAGYVVQSSCLIEGYGACGRLLPRHWS